MQVMEFAMWKSLRPFQNIGAASAPSRSRHTWIRTRIASGGLVALAVTGTISPARAQLIDPNNGGCVYAPGSTSCQPVRPPAPPPVSGPPYQQFLSLARNSGIDLGQHPGYSEQYFQQRAQLLCSLLRQGESMKITQEVQFPPELGWTETTQDRPRLETAILRVAALNYCQDAWPQEQQWEATFVR